MEHQEILTAILKKLEALEAGQKSLEAGQKSLEADQQTMSARMDAYQAQTNLRFDRLQSDMDLLKEDAAITRAGVNTLLDWAEKVETQVQIPLFNRSQE